MKPEYLIGAVTLLILSGWLIVWLVLGWKERAEARGYSRGYDLGYENGKAKGKADAEAKAAADAEAEKKRRVSSCMASDFPTAKPFEVVYAPTECVSLQAEVILSDREMEEATKGQVTAELARQIYSSAIPFIDIQQVDDPMLCGTRIRGVLRIVKVNR